MKKYENIHDCGYEMIDGKWYWMCLKCGGKPKIRQGLKLGLSERC